MDLQSEIASQVAHLEIYPCTSTSPSTLGALFAQARDQGIDVSNLSMRFSQAMASL